jgi:glycosyltransferase involved in cell wall biosynthesis
MTTHPIRVAHVTLGLSVGGQEKLLVEFARQADRRLFDLRFVSLGGRGALADEIEQCGWPVTHLDAPARLSGRLVPCLARLFSRWRINVVHTHEDRPLVYGVPAACLAGARAIIHTRHGQSPRLTSRQRALVSLAARWADRFVCVSHDSANLTIGHGVSPRKVCTIWNGIDLDRYPSTGPLPHGPAVCVARLSPEKGIDTLVRAVSAVIRCDPTFRLEIAGDGACRAALTELIEKLSLQKHVRLLGQINDVSSLLARASLFVLPSLSEGIPLTILEAMARGLPIVATRVGGTVEAVVEGKTGVLVPPADSAALSAALLQMRGEAGWARALGLAGRRRVEQNFDVRVMVARYEELYRACGRRAQDKTARSRPPCTARRLLLPLPGSS